jgi:hypothetical protein
MHIRDTRKKKETPELRGAMAYEGGDRSETALARAVHLLTLGAYAWQNASPDNKEWRKDGGGSIGSVFFDRSDDSTAPTAKEWVSAALLANPRLQQASEWCEGEENCLQLLRRLAVDGGFDGGFVAQDKAVQAGAAWLCEFASSYNNEANKMLNLKESVDDTNEEDKQETDIEKRKRLAKEKAMERMKAQAAKFASMMQAELGEKEENDEAQSGHGMESPTPQRHIFRQGSFASGSSVASTSDSEKAAPVSSSDALQGILDEPPIPARLLKCRPQCIICSDDGSTYTRPRIREEEGHRKSRRRRNDGGNALAFVGYTQASTVMKGGGGPASSGNVYSVFSPVRRFVGAHLALCGHAIHSECWESYLATVSHREDRIVGKRDEFRCPLCQRLSNCLVPFIDVGVDWIDPASSSMDSDPSSPMDVSKSKSQDGLADAMSCESLDISAPLPVQEFLSSTPWWVARHNDSVTWDGQCAFVSESTAREESNQGEMEDATTQAISPRRRSVRPLRKKDLYAAWNAMMKTPRYVRKKLRPNLDSSLGDMSTSARAPDSFGSQITSSSSETAGETVVWRRFMDQVSDITYRADGKRLGDENLHSDFGEFRHYIAEKYAYNMANRFAGREPTDWPSCVFSTTLSDTQRQELSREKLLSKLMMTMQAFTYSACCEANEARRLIQKMKSKISSRKVASMPSISDNNDFAAIFSKYGIANIVCDDKLLIMPKPDLHEDDGSQPFNGRLGRLRYFGLAVMAAAGAVAADLVQLVLAFPLKSSLSAAKTQPYRAPIVYPLLHGHVLTHVVAAISASAGRARARSDALEFVWPVPFSSKGSFVASDGFGLQKNVDSVVDDAEGFIKLGLLARILQVLLGKIDVLGLNNISGLNTEFVVLKTLKKLRSDVLLDSSDSSRWTINCIALLEVALSNYRDGEVPETSHAENAIVDRFQEGCVLAADAACAFLADAGVIMQLLVPGIIERYPMFDVDNGGDNSSNPIETLSKLETFFRLESFSKMLESDLVGQIVSNWYETARNHAISTKLPSARISGTGAAVTSRLFQTQGFRVYEWPMESCHDVATIQSGHHKPHRSDKSQDGETELSPMEIDQVKSSNTAVLNPTSRKCVPLIGGFTSEIPVKNSGRPRVAMIPTSYTDLYAELGQLLPESEQTAVCLICGEVLNAGGKGECTRHSYKCGAGTGLFFLLQECAGLIMHNGKAAYIHSPYVDSHGETPQYRGRPLNLDLDRYGHLHEVWSGHSIRQQVLAERGSSRQIIVPDFY